MKIFFQNDVKMEAEFLIKSGVNNITAEELMTNLTNFREKQPKFFIRCSIGNAETGMYLQWTKIYFTASAYEYTMTNKITGEVARALTIMEHESITNSCKRMFLENMNQQPPNDDWFEFSSKMVNFDKPHYFMMNNNNVYEFELIMQNLDPLFFEILGSDKVMAFKMNGPNGSSIFYKLVNYEESVEKLRSALMKMNEEICKIFEFYGGKFD